MTNKIAANKSQAPHGELYPILLLYPETEQHQPKMQYYNFSTKIFQYTYVLLSWHHACCTNIHVWLNKKF